MTDDSVSKKISLMKERISRLKVTGHIPSVAEHAYMADHLEEYSHKASDDSYGIAGYAAHMIMETTPPRSCFDESWVKKAFDRAPPDSHIAMYGRPFVGYAGQEHDRVLDPDDGPWLRNEIGPDVLVVHGGDLYALDYKTIEQRVIAHQTLAAFDNLQMLAYQHGIAACESTPRPAKKKRDWEQRNKRQKRK
jgi:hypothetical protein